MEELNPHELEMIRKQLPKENNRVVMSPSFRRSQIPYLETQLPCEHRFIFRTRRPTSFR